MKLTTRVLIFRIVVWPAEQWTALCGWFLGISVKVEDRLS
jgi:hypothetical protein